MNSISLVTAVYNVAGYLDDFFTSLEAQSCGLENLEIILVDDGSTDESGLKLRDFSSKYENVRVVTKDNGGQASARNLGLKYVTSDWVTFPDPDDVLNDTYFEAAFGAIDGLSDDVALIATRAILYHENRGSISDSHPMSHRWESGARTVDLATEIRSPHLMVNTSIFRYSLIKSAELEFNEQLRVRFEDGAFVCNYFAFSGRHKYLLVPGAEYLYRRRADNSSSVQNAMTTTEMYDSIVREGYIPALLAFSDNPPTWAQMAVLYDLFWILKADAATAGPSHAVDASTADEFIEDLRELLKYIDPSSIWAFNLMYVSGEMRRKLYALHPLAGETFSAEVADFLPIKKLAHLTFWSARPQDAAIRTSSGEIQPRHQKDQYVQILGRRVATIKHLWVSTRDSFSVEVNGRPLEFLAPVPLEADPNTGNYYKLLATELRRDEQLQLDLGPSSTSETTEPSLNFSAEIIDSADGVRSWGVNRLKNFAGQIERIKRVLLAILMNVRDGSWPYHDVWILMDRTDEANDSAEALYWWLNERHPELRVRFVLSRKSPHFRRMRKQGAKLLPFNSLRHHLAVLQGKYFISSHIDQAQQQPFPVVPFGVPKIRYVFLQHGIIKDDISAWLNPKRIDLFVTSTDKEYSEIADNGNYAFSTAQVRLTGLPRHDVLAMKHHELKKQGASDKVLLIAPTWRRSLNSIASSKEFSKTTYANQWAELLGARELKNLAEEAGLRIVFLPHPLLARFLDGLEVPDYVQVVTYDEVDVQSVMASAAAMITDYSSIAFNSAYLEKPVAYFQFDIEEFYASHTGDIGYFDYHEDGFGPVSTSSSELISGLHDVLLGNVEAYGLYKSRMERVFPLKDGKNRERVFNAILDLERIESNTESVLPFEAESWEKISASAMAVDDSPHQFRKGEVD